VDTNRYTRLRELVHSVNRQRKIQARKIDILCTDMVTAHRAIIDRLESLTFITRVHESLIGCSSTQEVLAGVSALFAERFGECGIALVTLDADGVTVCDTHVGLSDEVKELPSYFTAENIRAICAANRACTLPEMLELPAEIPPKTVEKATAVAVPMRNGREAIGLVLLYNDVERQLPPRLIHTAAAVAPAVGRVLAAAKPVTAR
jgi:hypothetical protein